MVGVIVDVRGLWVQGQGRGRGVSVVAWGVLSASVRHVVGGSVVVVASVGGSVVEGAALHWRDPVGQGVGGGVPGFSYLLSFSIVGHFFARRLHFSSTRHVAFYISEDFRGVLVKEFGGLLRSTRNACVKFLFQSFHLESV